MLLAGEEVPQNIDKAETYLRKAAKQNFLPAIIALAEFYARGNGIQPDLRESAEWYRRAAEAGDVQAQFIIGRLSMTGDGVPVNERETAKWFLRAAEQGNATAAHNIAVYYAEGTGIEQDLDRAVAWFEKAAAAGVSAAQVQLGKLYASGHGVRRDLTRASEFLRRAAESGDAEAKTALALMHLQGDNVLDDAGQAEHLLRQAAEAGHPGAATQLGHLCTNKSRNDDAIRWYRKAAEAGQPEAQQALGVAYFNGRGVPGDLGTAADWISRAAQANYPAAQFQLGVMYCTGKGVPMDYTLGVSWYEQAAQAGHALAQYNLGVMLSKGQGCDADPARGAVWLEKAAEQGVEQARTAIRGQVAPRVVAPPESPKSAAAIQLVPVPVVSVPAAPDPKSVPSVPAAAVPVDQPAGSEKGCQAMLAPPAASAQRTEPPKPTSSGDKSRECAPPANLSEPKRVDAGQTVAVDLVREVTPTAPPADEPARRSEPSSSAPTEALAQFLTQLRRSPAEPRPHLVPWDTEPDVLRLQKSETAALPAAPEPDGSLTSASVAGQPADRVTAVADARGTASGAGAPGVPPHFVSSGKIGESARARPRTVQERVRPQAGLADQRDVQTRQTDPWVAALIQKLEELQNSWSRSSNTDPT
jgi:TPR repeat protein